MRINQLMKQVSTKAKQLITRLVIRCVMLVPFPVRFVDTGRLPITLDSCLRGND